MIIPHRHVPFSDKTTKIACISSNSYQIETQKYLSNSQQTNLPKQTTNMPKQPSSIQQTLNKHLIHTKSNNNCSNNNFIKHVRCSKQYFGMKQGQ